MQDQKNDRPEPQRYKPSMFDVVAKLVFYTHLVLSAVFATVLIVLHPYIVTPTLTFISLAIYGYMIVWVAIINILLLVQFELTQCINRVSWSIWLVRIGIKLLISFFPVLAVVSYFKESWLYLQPMLYFMAYLTAFSALYIVYEISAYFCCQRTNPDWVYRVSRGELADIRKAITERRKQFLQHHN